MSAQRLDLVVGQAVTDRDLRSLQEAAAVGAAVLSAAGSSGCAVEVRGFEAAQKDAPTFQEQPHWCWAASLQAILRHYGIRKDQSAIVSEVYGAAVNLPELNPAQLYHIVNADMTREDGTTCVVRGRYFPGALLTGPVLYNELKSQHPVMVVHRTGPSIGHAVVLYGATFGPFGPVTVKYFDPTPGQGLGEANGLSLETQILRWFAINGGPSLTGVRAAAARA